MNTSLRIATFFGIPVQVHWTFGLLIAWLVYGSYQQGYSMRETALTGLFFVAIFVCVILHEYGHALTARYFGVGTRDITISPIGGIARLDRMPEKPYQELLVAIAGPLVNVAIAVVLLLMYLLYYGMQGAELRDMLFGFFMRDSNFFPVGITIIDIFLLGMVALNSILAVFNMLPAFPMDGGRVLRALLSIRLGRLRATRIATIIGQLVAGALAVYGLMNGNMVTVLIGAFVFFAAAGENRSVRMEAFMASYKISDIIRTQFTRIYVGDTIMTLAQLLQHGLERHFLVFDHTEALQGFVAEQDILEQVKAGRLDDSVDAIMQEAIPPLCTSSSLRSVMHIFQTAGDVIIPVHEDGQLVGVVDQQLVEQFLRTQRKLKLF
jgi:Zn-dependent protease/predicted transcriptional regulator